ncbi:MAG TPA: VOC family protein [Cyclobacteriaceae bacterium]|nr:VOC family protein [Cyclobacteriaceae bacterium]
MMRYASMVLFAASPTISIAQSQTRPFLIALQGDDLARSMTWYRDIFGFSQTRTGVTL